MIRARCVIGALAALFLAGPFPIAPARAAVECAILSADGASHLQIEDAVTRGVMPHLASLMKRGAVVEGLIPAGPDASTPPSHASLWTGAPSVVHGITGFMIHPGDGDPGECGSGFDATFLRAETLWSAAHRAGRKVFLLNTPVSTPAAVFRGKTPAALWILNGFEDLRSHSGAIEGRLVDGKAVTPIAGHMLRFSRTATGLEVAGEAGAVTLASGKDARMTGPLKLGKAPGDPRVFLRLLVLEEGSGRFVLHHSPPEGMLSDDPALHHEFVEATGGFGGQGPRESYKAGVFGVPLPEGGDGSAEARYVEIARFAMDQVIAGIRFGAKKDPALLMTYVTQPDEVNHMWAGWMMPESPYHDPVLARKLLPYQDQLLAKVDEVVGTLIEVVGPDGHVIVTSDHGRIPILRHVYPNRILAAKGLLQADADGVMDPDRTSVAFPCQSSHFMRLGWRAGDGGFAHARQLVAQVTDHLLELRDPKTRARVFTGVLDVDLLGRRNWFGGDAAGDILLLPAPGYHLESDMAPGEIFEEHEPLGTGMHASHAGIPTMHALCVMAGPRVEPGVRLPSTTHLHFAPTVAALMGIPAPAQAATGPVPGLVTAAK